MTTFYLLRHGESTFNTEKRWTGQADAPLSELGLCQAEEAAKRLCHHPIDCIYSSDLQRAKDTARPTALRLALPIHTDPDLRELCAGVWEGLTVAHVAEAFPEEYKSWGQKNPLTSPPMGESYADVQKRAYAALCRIAKQEEGKRVLVATHGGLIRTLICLALDEPIEQVYHITTPTNASLTILQMENGRLFADWEEADNDLPKWIHALCPDAIV